MHHILNVKQIFIGKIFLDWDYDHFKPFNNLRDTVIFGTSPNLESKFI